MIRTTTMFRMCLRQTIIDRVILLYHGDIGAFWVGNSCIETEYIKVRFNDANGYISELQDKDIQILDLKICHSGDISATNIDTGSYSPGTIEYERGYNIAIDFLINIPGIKCVRAWDGSYKFENNWLGHYERSFTSEGIINEFCYAYTWSNRVNSFWINTDYDIVRDGIYAYDTTLEFMKWISL